MFGKIAQAHRRRYVSDCVFRPNSKGIAFFIGDAVVKLGCTELIEVLLSAGADHTVRDPVFGLTVLHDAAREGFEDAVRVLVDHGADVNAADARSNLPLHLAAAEGHQSVVKLLEGRTG